MPRPSSTELLAIQLEHAAAAKADYTAAPAVSAPPSSSSGSVPAPFGSSDFSTGPSSATAYSDESANRRQRVKSDGQGNRGDAVPIIIRKRGGTGRAGVQNEDETDETDDDLEDELNDFGFGAPKMRREKKETLLDILNSEPPDWMVQAPLPAGTALDSVPPRQPKRSMTSRLRQRFGSVGPAPTVAESESLKGLSTLRTSQSAGNLLSSLRGRLGSAATTLHRSRDDLAQTQVPSGPIASASQSSLLHHSAESSSSSLIAPPLAPIRPHRKLTAKEASSLAEDATTRELVEFLRSSGPTEGPRGGTALPSKPSSLSLGSKPRSTLHKPDNSISRESGQRSRSAHSAASSMSGSTYTMTGGAALAKVAIVKLGASVRRASLTPQGRTGTWPAEARSAGKETGSAMRDVLTAKSVDDVSMKKSAVASTPAATRTYERRASAGAASVMDISEFVTIDEQLHQQHQYTGLPVETRAGDLAERAAAVALHRGTSQSSAMSASHSHSPRATTPQRISRKPVPTAIPPIEDLFAATTTPQPVALVDDCCSPSPQPIRVHSPPRFQDARITPTRADQATKHAPPALAPSDCTTVTLADYILPNIPASYSLAYDSRSTSRRSPSDASQLSPGSTGRVSTMAMSTDRAILPAAHAPMPGRPNHRTRQSSGTISTPSSPSYRRVSFGNRPAVLASLVRETSSDSLLNPPLSAARSELAQAVGASVQGGSRDLVLSALDDLRACLDVSSSLSSTFGEITRAYAGDDLARAMAPVLEHLCQQMRCGAQLVEAALTHLGSLGSGGGDASLEKGHGRGADMRNEELDAVETLQSRT